MIKYRFDDGETLYTATVRLFLILLGHHITVLDQDRFRRAKFVIPCGHQSGNGDSGGPCPILDTRSDRFAIPLYSTIATAVVPYVVRSIM